MLQRIYGTAWESKAALDDHLHRLEEAEKRDHRRLAVELDLLSFPVRARRRPRRVAPQGRRHPQADGGLQPRPARRRRLRVRVQPAPGPGAGVRDLRPPRLVQGEHVPGHGHGQRVVLPEAHELPDPLPDLPQPHAQLPGAAAAARSSWAPSTATSGRARCTDSCASAASPRTTATSSAPGSRRRTEIRSLLNFVLSVLRAFGFEDFEANLSTRDPMKSIGAEDGWDQRHRDPARGAGGRGSELRGQGGRRRLLRAQDRHRRARRHRPALAAVHHPVRLQPAGALRAGVRGRRQRAAPAGDDPPRPVRFGGALLRGAGRALRRGLPGLAGAGAGSGAAGGRRPTRPTPREVAARLQGEGFRVDQVEATDQLGKRIRAAKLEKIPYVLVVGDDDVAGGTVGVNPAGRRASSEACSVDDFVARLRGRGRRGRRRVGA